tara:strand:+ start:538 stop:999 length:462 start_codon:yes stop_codon:yes gene_type:complete
MALNVLSSINEIFRREVAVSAALVDPTDATCLVAGEWVQLNGSGTAIAAPDPTSTTPPTQSLLLFQVFSKKGDYSAQALGKVTILNSFDYIAETDQYDTNGAYAAGTTLGVNAAGQLVPVSSAGDKVYAIALGAPASGGLLKYQRVSPFVLHA